MTSLVYPRAGYEPVKRKLSGPIPDWSLVPKDGGRLVTEAEKHQMVWAEFLAGDLPALEGGV